MALNTCLVWSSVLDQTAGLFERTVKERLPVCRDLYGDISLPGGIVLSSFTKKWAETTLALDANDLGRLPWPARALKYATRCALRIERARPNATCASTSPDDAFSG